MDCHPRLRNIEDNSITEVSKSPFTMGRGLEADFIIKSKTVSRTHCTLSKSDQGWILIDSENLLKECSLRTYHEAINLTVLLRLANIPDKVQTMESTNGTMVNEDLYKACPSSILRNNDNISLGCPSHTYKFLLFPIIEEAEVSSTTDFPMDDEVSDDVLNMVVDDMLNNVDTSSRKPGSSQAGVDENAQQNQFAQIADPVAMMLQPSQVGNPEIVVESNPESLNRLVETDNSQSMAAIMKEICEGGNMATNDPEVISQGNSVSSQSSVNTITYKLPHELNDENNVPSEDESEVIISSSSNHETASTAAEVPLTATDLSLANYPFDRFRTSHSAHSYCIPGTSGSSREATDFHPPPLIDKVETTSGSSRGRIFDEYSMSNIPTTSMNGGSSSHPMTYCTNPTFTDRPSTSRFNFPTSASVIVPNNHTLANDQILNLSTYDDPPTSQSVPSYSNTHKRFKIISVLPVTSSSSISSPIPMLSIASIPTASATLRRLLFVPSATIVSANLTTGAISNNNTRARELEHEVRPSCSREVQSYGQDGHDVSEVAQEVVISLEKSTCDNAETNTNHQAEPKKQENEKPDQFEEMENELMCTICANLFIKAVTLGCSHSFCQYCINTWKKKKSDCPICRIKIASSIRTLVLDNIIEKMMETASEEHKNQRQADVTERNMIEAEEDRIKNERMNNNNNRNRARRGRRNRRGNSRRAEVVQVVDSPPVVTISSPSTTDSEPSDVDDYDGIINNPYNDDLWYDQQRNPYYGGYGRCYSCGQRGHWANTCPYR